MGNNKLNYEQLKSVVVIGQPIDGLEVIKNKQSYEEPKIIDKEKGDFKHIVKRLGQTLQSLEQEYKQLEETGVIKRSEDGKRITKYYDSHGLFTIGEIRVRFFESYGLFTVGYFCKKIGFDFYEAEGQVKRLYELNGMEYNNTTLYSTSWINNEYAEYLLKLLMRSKLYKEKILLTARENDVPTDVVSRTFLTPIFIKEKSAYLTDIEIEECVSEIKSWVSLVDISKENNLDLEATLIAGERIVGKDRLYKSYSNKDRNKAIRRRVVTQEMVKDILQDSQYWMTIGELSELINIPVERIIKTYSKLRRQQVRLYPIIDKFNENTIISERQMIDKIIDIETRVNPTRNYFDEEIKESKVGIVPNLPNSKIGKYLSKKGRKGQGHY